MIHDQFHSSDLWSWFKITLYLVMIILHNDLTQHCKHVPAFRFQSVSRRWRTGVVFMQSGVKVNGAWTTTVMSCCSNSCCQTSIKLLVSFTFQCTTRAQEHRAAVTQDSGLHTRHATCVNMPMTLTLSFLPQIVILGTLSLTKLNHGPATIILN